MARDFSRSTFSKRGWSLVVAFALTAMGTAPQAFAQKGYPDKPIRVVVPYSAGGNTDIIAREVMKRMSVELGQPIVIDNKPGANSILGTESVARAAPDGYTLLVPIGAYANNYSLYKKLPYKLSDLVPVSQLTRTSLVLVTALPGVRDVKGLIAKGSDANAPLTFASSGVGSAAHILGERLSQGSGMSSSQHIPYKGTADAVSDLLTSRVGFMFDAISAMGSHIKSGRLTALAVTGENPSDLLPGVPSMAAAGYPDMVAYAWAGLLAPARTPPEIVDLLARTAAKVLADPSLKEKLASISTEPVGSRPDEFKRFLDEEMAVNGKVIKKLNISLD